MHESQLYTGRPEKGSRADIEERSYDLLDALDIAYTRVDHARAATMDDLAAAEAVLGCGIAKNLFLTNRQQTDFYLLIMPGHKPFKTKYLSAQLGCSRLSFATEEHLGSILGVESGCASVLALMNDSDRKVRLVFDKDILSAEQFACHPCLNSTSLAFPTAELGKITAKLGYEPSIVELPENPE